MISHSEIRRALEDQGLEARGGFHAVAADGVPVLPGERAAATLILAGNAGPTMWAAFTLSPEYREGSAHALDRWSARVLRAIAAKFGGMALLPSEGPPYHPFQRWAQRAEPLHPSPLGVLIHPVHGVWHAYRGALAFAEAFDLPDREDLPSPCETCTEKPCLSTCPVGAFTPQGYDVPACASHIATPAGADCLDLGCRARRACPVGRDSLYEPAQARFHMAAFLKARQGGTA